MNVLLTLEELRLIAKWAYRSDADGSVELFKKVTLAQVEYARFLKEGSHGR